ncbi:hypothetical protein CEB3_c29500 [Peptococcaceae bacterium CEB3]|nr:hypothetical protein CEB3_c29500 [Peptococcaceae bacterium CEB3]
MLLTPLRPLLEATRQYGFAQGALMLTVLSKSKP